MARTTGLRSVLRRIRRFSTLGRPRALEACYLEIWRLPRPDLHRQADGDFQGTPRLASKAHMICHRYATALEASQQGRLVICCEEKTGMQVLERKAPSQPAQPGRRGRREHEDIRHGTRVLINVLAVVAGQIAWTIGTTRKATDFVAPLKKA